MNSLGLAQVPSVVSVKVLRCGRKSPISDAVPSTSIYFFSRFAELAAGILLHRGFKVYLFSKPTPTPFNVSCVYICV